MMAYLVFRFRVEGAHPSELHSIYRCHYCVPTRTEVEQKASFAKRKEGLVPCGGGSVLRRRSASGNAAAKG